ncbi:MAG TPA: aromatic ring-hydroxylating dioxygenase subunit alpha [Kofleriaceae bacterium]|nr:aromatic ring-hydroxylating dioxygenase subunit alpha [Kofleriaceae bacterium]
MQRATLHRLLDQLRAPGGGMLAPRRADGGVRPAFRVPAARYLDAAHFERERAALFGGMSGGRLHGPPRVIAASAALAAGGCLPVDLPGVSLILTRGGDGAVRALANACRHRATRLVDAPCTAKALVCPYHGWTYDLGGKLLHVPHAEAFADGDRRDLPVLPVAERHGLIWLGAAAGDRVAGHLGELDADLAALELGRHAVWRSRRQTRTCNWKLIVEAFLDAYHIRILHRDTVHRFFLDASSIAEPVGPHIRAVSARRTLREAPPELPADGNLRALGTASYLVAPATIVVVHPDSVSVQILHPRSVGETDYEHILLVPADRLDDAVHWDKNWALLDEAVFQREDLWVCEQAQRGLAAGTSDALVFGELESAVRDFHATIDAAIDAVPAVA